MCFYIGIEDLAANALIEILKTKEDAQMERCRVTLAELEAYGNQVIQYLNERGEKAVLILSRENTSLMFRNYSVFFEDGIGSGRKVQNLLGVRLDDSFCECRDGSCAA